MIKITTLFKKDPTNLGRVINEIDPNNAWALEYGIPTRKFDGTACMVKNGQFYKRLDCKRGKPIPNGAIPCQEPDPITGHHPHWILCDRNNPADKWHWIAFDSESSHEDGTYEACGPHFSHGVNNPENLEKDILIKHGCEILDIKDFSFESIKAYLSNPELDIEGIVFHASNGSGRMCKIRKSDFGIKR